MLKTPPYRNLRTQQLENYIHIMACGYEIVCSSLTSKRNNTEFILTPETTPLVDANPSMLNLEVNT